MSTSAERMRRLRERQRAGLAPAEGARLRDAADLLAPAVAESVEALELGVVDLARLEPQVAAIVDRLLGQRLRPRPPQPPPPAVTPAAAPAPVQVTQMGPTPGAAPAVPPVIVTQPEPAAPPVQPPFPAPAGGTP